MTEERRDAEEQENREQLDQIRESIGRGVAFLQSMAFADHLDELTFTASIARSVTVIEEDESDIRPGKINALTALKNEVHASVTQALKLPGELFAIEEEEEDDEG